MILATGSNTAPMYIIEKKSKLNILRMKKSTGNTSDLTNCHGETKSWSFGINNFACIKIHFFH